MLANQNKLVISSNILDKVKFNEISLVCFDFISFLILKIVIECPEEIFKTLLSVTTYLYNNSWEYSFLCCESSFWTFANVSLLLWLKYKFPENFNLLKNWLFSSKKLFSSIFPVSTTLRHIYDYVTRLNTIVSYELLAVVHSELYLKIKLCIWETCNMGNIRSELLFMIWVISVIMSNMSLLLIGSY